MKVILLDEKKRIIIGSDKPVYGTLESASSMAKLWLETYNNGNPDIKADSWHLIGKPKYKEKSKK